MSWIKLVLSNKPRRKKKKGQGENSWRKMAFRLIVELIALIR